MGALDGDTPTSSSPPLETWATLSRPATSRRARAEPEPEPETEDAPAAGNLSPLRRVQGRRHTIDEAVDLDYGDDESESESDSAPAGLSRASSPASKSPRRSPPRRNPRGEAHPRDAKWTAGSAR